MSFITLLTDFGIRDGGVAVMKGVILGIAPEVRIEDLSHTIAPQNIQEAAILLRRVIPYFPAGAIHVIVVDPGVGTHRRPIAGRFGDQYFVAPDNGVVTPLLEFAQANDQPVEIVHLNKPEYWLDEISHVFHGRDIFSPVGAHLAAGVPLEKLGTPIYDPVLWSYPQPTKTAAGWHGEVVQIDDFGNLATNIFERHLQDMGPVSVRVNGIQIYGLIKTFGERPVGTLVALIGTDHDLIISVVNGSAAARLGTQLKDIVEVMAMES
jgi:hypothetical protein